MLEIAPNREQVEPRIEQILENLFRFFDGCPVYLIETSFRPHEMKSLPIGSSGNDVNLLECSE